MQLSGQVVVVSGAASGLGRRTAEVFARAHGARVAGLDIADAPADGWMAEHGPEHAMYLPVDVTDDTAVGVAVLRVLEAFGRIDVCINCAGIPGPLRIVDRGGEALGCATFRRVVAVNLLGTFNVMSHCAAAMLKNTPSADGERGVVINTSSGAAFEGQAGQTAYAASKAGIVGLTLPAARELSRHGIRVNAIAPGLFDTPMAQGAPELLQSLTAMIEFPKRLGDSAEFASLCAYICGNQYLNGECIRLDAATRLRAR